MKRRAVDGALGFWGERLFCQSLRSAVQAAHERHDSRTRPLSGGEVRRRLRALFCHAPEVMVKVTGGGRGMAPIRAHMSYISRGGRLELEDERGDKIVGRAALGDLVQEWRFAGSAIASRSHRREALHVMLSMPHDVDAQVVFCAARDFAQSALAHHKFAMVLHEPHSDPRSKRPHVHLIVRKQGLDGNRLHPSRADLACWRQEFADRLAERGVAANATRRHVRGEAQGHVRPRAQIAQAVPGQGTGILLSERATASQDYVLSAWRGVASALSVSEDPEDRILARQTLDFMLRMPILSRQRRLSFELERIDRGPAAGRIEEIRAFDQSQKTTGRKELERTR
ncbi:MAG TPA: conjugal transfer protein TraS [Burkholderiaceae bacterium]|nr:conjugal transfer protein TraS [Burkholderiaceae bacterium]